MVKRRLAADRYVLAAGQQLQGQRSYRIEAYVASGAFAAGYRAVDERGQAFFVKEYLPPQWPGERAEVRRMYDQECDVLRRIGNYELTPRFHDAFETSGFMYLV